MIWQVLATFMSTPIGDALKAKKSKKRDKHSLFSHLREHNYNQLLARIKSFTLPNLCFCPPNW